MNSSSRRNFLKNATGLVATSLVANTAMAQAINKNGVHDENKELIFRTLGRTGVKIPIVSMGVMNSNNPNLLKFGWQSGIRHFDTAWIYQNGNNEKMVGNVVKELKIERKDVVVTTKIVIDQNLWQPDAGEKRKEQLLSRFQQSLDRLQMDYVDILMFHDAVSPQQILDPYITGALSELKEQGKIRFPAFSTHAYWPEILSTAADQGFYDVVLLSLNYSMASDEASYKALGKAYEKGIGLIAMKTQCQQDWYKQNLPAETQKFYEGNVMHSALLKWVLRHEQITTAVPGFTTFEQLLTDVQVGHDLEYTGDEKTFLEDHHVKLAMQSVCHFCGACKDSCPKGVDIPALMRTHMYSLSYGNPHMSKATYHSIEPGRGLDACNLCSECVAKCKNQVAIASRVDELKHLA
jgi:uncharacterized protein